MHGVGEQFLACSAFAKQQHGNIRGGDPAHHIENAKHRGALPDYVVETVLLVKTLAKVGYRALLSGVLGCPANHNAKLVKIEGFFDVVERPLLKGGSASLH